MSGQCESVINVLFIGGAIALVWCGIAIAKPNLHGIKFVEGNCTISSVTTISDWGDLPTCSCGKSCSEEYPCLTVYASFESTSNGTDHVNFTRGTVHDDYGSLKSNCLVKPEGVDYCSSDFTKNSELVYRYFIMVIAPLVNYDTRYPYLEGWNVTVVNYTDVPSFHCWGYDNDIYIEHSYSVLKAQLALGVPAGCILLGLLLSIYGGSDDQREMAMCVLFCPCALLSTMCGWSDIQRQCRDCKRGVTSCIRSCLACRCCRDNRERGRDVEISERVASPRRRVRRRSIDLFTAERYTLQAQQSTISIRTRSASEGSLDLHSLEAARRYRLSSSSIGIELPPYIPPSYPASYNAAAPSYPTAPSYPVPNITGPMDAPPYTSTMDMPPPPSYDEVVSSEHRTYNL